MIGNSYLFAGRNGIGKGHFAIAFAEELLGKKVHNHPDVRVYRPEGKIAMHSMDSLRRLTEEVYLPPYESKWKVFIIHEADRMLPTSANALLKTFEEPSKDSIIILLSSQPSALLPTVISRCRRIHFQPIPTKQIEEWLIENHNCENPETIAQSAQGSLGHAEQLFQKGDDPLRKELFTALSNTPFKTYGELKSLAESLAKTLSERKEEHAEEAKKTLFPPNLSDLTASQKETYQKELDGAVACQFQDEVDDLLNLITSWFRDSQLLLEGGHPSLLQNPDYQDSLSQNPPPLDQILTATEKARLSIKRFSSLPSVLEALLLRLGLYE